MIPSSPAIQLCTIFAYRVCGCHIGSMNACMPLAMFTRGCDILLTDQAGISRAAPCLRSLHSTSTTSSSLESYYSIRSPPMTAAIETPSKAAAFALSHLDVKEESPMSTSLLSKMQAATDSDRILSSKVDNRVHSQITLESGKKIKHASTAPRGKFVGDLSITDDSQEPLLQETEQRFVLFPIKYHEVC